MQIRACIVIAFTMLIGVAPLAAYADATYTGVKLESRTIYKGIEYAEAERWKHSALIEAHGEIDATRFGAICPQMQGELLHPLSDENCLFLNISMPNAPIENAPVMVWFHGGGYRNGSGNELINEGQRFADAGVILVTVNYRLGLLGNIALENVQGNFALGDMVNALRWVGRRIDHFGGDPNNVTIFGQSAGGLAVQMLTSAPSAEGLFERAIVQSGYGTWPLPRLDELAGVIAPSAQDVTQRILNNANIQNAHKAELIELVSAPKGFLLPIVDGVVLTDEPVRRFLLGEAKPVSMIIGANSFDGNVFPYSGVSFTDFSSLLGDQFELLLPLYRQNGDTVEIAVARMFGDFRYLLAARMQSESLTLTDTPSYLYYFDYVPFSKQATWPGAPHGTEQSLILNASSSVTADIKANDQIGEVLFTNWIQFARGELDSMSFAPSDEGVEWNSVSSSPLPEGFEERIEILREVYLSRLARASL